MLLSSTAPQVIGLRHHEQNLLDQVWVEWIQKQPRNLLRRQYLDSKQVTRQLGISIPPALQDLEVAIGLPEIAVEGMASRVHWEGIVSDAGNDDPFELEEVLDDNRFDIEFPQTVRSALGQSVAFQSVSLGDVASGEPRIRVLQHSALWSAAIWDPVRRGLKVFLDIRDTDDLGRPTMFVLMTPDVTVTCFKSSIGWAVTGSQKNPLPRVTVEPIPYAPTLERPFGVSRVSRRVMNLTDRAVRATLRMEVHSEAYSAPKFLLMGADEAAFHDANGAPIPLWNWYMTRLNAIPASIDESTGARVLPTLEEIAQQSPMPHIEDLRAIYSQFAGETKIPLNSLGIVQDNPASAESLYAMKEDLVIGTNGFIAVAKYALNRTMQNMVMLRDGLDTPTRELRRISQRFRNPAMPSVVSQSDAVVKQVSAIPDLALSDVILEELGYTEEQIFRIRADIRRSQGSSLARELIEAAKARRVGDGDSAKVDGRGVAVGASVGG